jgi:hypothetical protein
MHSWKSTLWLLLTGFVAVFLLVPSLPLQAALKLKKKAAKAVKSVAKYKVKTSKAKKAKRHRRVACNVVQGKAQALAFIQSSKEIAALAGIEYRPDPNLQKYMDDDGEDLGDEFDFSELPSDEDALEDDMSENFAADVNAFQKLWLSYMQNVDPEMNNPHSDILTQAGLRKNDVMAAIMDWVGAPYRYGGMQRGGIDCSAFTLTVHRMVCGITLPRSAASQFSVGAEVQDGEKLEFGDLVFFNTRRAVYVSHVGIYLGDNFFAHASSRYGVTVSSLGADYYKKRFIGARRLRPADIDNLLPQRLGHIYGSILTKNQSSARNLAPVRSSGFRLSVGGSLVQK